MLKNKLLHSFLLVLFVLCGLILCSYIPKSKFFGFELKRIDVFSDIKTERPKKEIVKVRPLRRKSKVQ